MFSQSYSISLLRNVTMDVKEIQIPVPWGHVAAKAWGNEKDTPVLVSHGVLDNAGMFDRLIPLLPNSFYYLCIDLPSHGRSSHYPPHLFITPLDVVITYKLILDHLNRKKYICMGHSWGGQIFALFTQLYPTYVLKLIILDGIYLFPLEPKYFKDYWSLKIDGLMKINEQLKTGLVPTYTYQEALNRTSQNRANGTITKETAENLLKRSLVPVEGGRYRIVTDQRLKVYTLFGADIRFMTGLVKKYPIRCPMLILKSPPSQEVFEQFHPLIDEMKKTFPNLQIEEVDGGHSGLSDYPEMWAFYVSKFLSRVSGKL